MLIYLVFALSLGDYSVVKSTKVIALGRGNDRRALIADLLMLITRLPIANNHWIMNFLGRRKRIQV
jgi:hypothetical protein